MVAINRVGTLSTGGLITNPIPGVGKPIQLRAEAALAASGAYVYTPVFSVERAQYVNLDVNYDPAAIGGAFGLYVVFSNAVAQPAAGDDSWWRENVVESSASTALGGAVPSGADYTAAPNWNAALLVPRFYTCRPAAAATDEYRERLHIFAYQSRWCQVAVAEHGVTGTPGAMALDYSLTS